MDDQKLLSSPSKHFRPSKQPQLTCHDKIVAGICVCTEAERLQREEGSREGGGDEMARSMFSIHEERLANGWSHGRGGGFAECALGILIHGHSSPPQSGEAPYLFCMPAHHAQPKKQVQTQHWALQTKHNITTFNTSSVGDLE